MMRLWLLNKVEQLVEEKARLEEERTELLAIKAQKEQLEKDKAALEQKLTVSFAPRPILWWLDTLMNA